MIYFSGAVGAQLMALRVNFSADERHVGFEFTFRARSPAWPHVDLVADDFHDVAIDKMTDERGVCVVARRAAFALDDMGRAVVAYTLTTGDVDLALRTVPSAIGASVSRNASRRTA